MVVRQSVCGGPSPSRRLGSELQALPWTSKGQRTERRSFLWLRYYFHSAAWSTFNHMRESVKRYECGMKDHALSSDNLLYHMHAGQNKNAKLSHIFFTLVSVTWKHEIGIFWLISLDCNKKAHWSTVRQVLMTHSYVVRFHLELAVEEGGVWVRFCGWLDWLMTQQNRNFTQKPRVRFPCEFSLFCLSHAWLVHKHNHIIITGL